MSPSSPSAASMTRVRRGRGRAVVAFVPLISRNIVLVCVCALNRLSVFELPLIIAIARAGGSAVKWQGSAHVDWDALSRRCVRHNSIFERSVSDRAWRAMSVDPADLPRGRQGFLPDLSRPFVHRPSWPVAVHQTRWEGRPPTGVMQVKPSDNSNPSGRFALRIVSTGRYC